MIEKLGYLISLLSTVAPLQKNPEEEEEEVLLTGGGFIDCL